MAVRYGYFNSVDGDRKYNAEDMTMYFKGLVSDGIYQTIGNMFAVTATSGLTVSIGTGRALVNMHWIECDAPFTITFDAASVSSDTYQLIVLRCNLADNVRSVGVFTKTSSDGTISLTNNDTVTELCIARVRIRANASSISQSDIRDYRGSSYCPWITGLIKQVDVSQLNAQFYKYYEEQTAELEAYMAQQKASFDSWLSSLQSELQVNTKLKKYQYSYEITTANEREIPLISNYEDGDVLLAHINGVLYVEGDEYTIDAENRKIILRKPATKDNLITQILIKSIIGGGSGGGITPKKLENVDLNTVTETGSYYADFDHTCKNVPSKVGSYGFSIIVTNGGGVVYQLLMKNTIDEKNRLFMRVIDSDGEVYPWSNYMQESDVTVDSVLSETSTRPPQNAIVTKRLNEIESKFR